MVADKKKYNPNLGGAFTNSKFANNGEDGILLNITEENYDVIMKNLRVGSTIALRYNKVTQKGNKHYFTEILPPFDKNAVKTNTAKVSAGSALD